jgi:hypothetical protein
MSEDFLDEARERELARLQVHDLRRPSLIEIVASTPVLLEAGMSGM